MLRAFRVCAREGSVGQSDSETVGQWTVLQPLPAMTNIHYLELFYYVVKARGISAAGRMTPWTLQQSTVSGQILLLEENIGKKFVRTPFQLLPAGEMLYNHIRPFFDGLDAVVDHVRNSAAPQFRIIASAYVLRMYMPDVFDMVQRRIPGMPYQILSGTQTEIEEMLRTSKVDIAIAALNGTIPNGVEALPLLRFRPVLLVPKTKEFRTYKTAEDFLRQRNVTVPLVCAETEGVARAFRRGLQLRGINWPVTTTVPATEFVTGYVAKGLHVGVSFDLPSMVDHPDVRVLPLKGFDDVPFGVLWHGAGAKPAAWLAVILDRTEYFWPTKRKPVSQGRRAA
jgi:DNA-binding transcriptional LysR family regulator